MDFSENKKLTKEIEDFLHGFGFIDITGYKNSTGYQKDQRVFAAEVKDNIFIIFYSQIGKNINMLPLDQLIEGKLCAVYQGRGISEIRNGHAKGLIGGILVSYTGTNMQIIEKLANGISLIYSRVDFQRVCKGCGSPLFLSKKNKRMCSRFCWDH